MKNMLIYFQPLFKPERLNWLIYMLLFLFVADNIINRYLHAPVFVVGAMVVSLGFAPYLVSGFKKNLWIYISLVILMMIMLLNSLKDGFHEKNISDLFFIVLFALSYLVYSSNRSSLKVNFSAVFIACSVLLLSGGIIESVTTVKINSGNKKTEVVAVTKSARLAESKELPDFESEPDNDQYSFNDHQKSAAGNMGDDTAIVRRIESKRIYNKGYFRIVHVAAYFFGFSGIFLAFWARKTNHWLLMASAVVLFSLSAYTGARSFIVALMLAVFIYLAKEKLFGYLIAAGIVVTIVFLFRYRIVSALHDNLFQQYFMLLVSIGDNFQQFTRVMLWQSWLEEVSKFRWYEFLIGKSYISGLRANASRFGPMWWFHNDFLGVFYTYGLAGLAFYVLFFRKIYIDCKAAIAKDPFIFVFYWLFLILALINGFYYYFPVFILYLFFLMLKDSGKTIEEDNSSNSLPSGDCATK